MDAPDQSVGDRGGEDQSHAEPREGARSQANIFVMCGCVWSQLSLTRFYGNAIAAQRVWVLS